MRSSLLRFANGPWAEPTGVALVLTLCVVGSVVEAYPAHHYGGLHLRSHPNPAAFLVVAVPAALLWWRRSHPVAVYLAAIAAVAAWAAMGQVYGAALVVVLVAFYFLALAELSRLVLVGLGVAGTFTIWLVGGLLGPWGWLGGPQLDMWFEMLAAGAVGAAVAARRQWKASKRLRYAQLEQAREEETRSRVVSERLRIARELHDVVAPLHLHDQCAGQRGGDAPRRRSRARRRRPPGDSRRQQEWFTGVAISSRCSAPSRRGTTAVPLPDGEAFQALADAATAAGIETRLRCDARITDLPAETALGAYRIVQESLTNVIRHAPKSAAEVTINDRDGQLLIIDVVDDGPRGSESFVDGTGTGLTGMHERARALGGQLRASSVASGGFSVHAELPMRSFVPDAFPLVASEVRDS